MGHFAGAARRYWLGVFPCVCREVRNWRERASAIPDPALRRAALENLHGERLNLDGAAAFAAFSPAPRRAAVVRAQVAFQAAYDYVDTLAEQRNPEPIRNGRHLHRALLSALEPALPGIDLAPARFDSAPAGIDLAPARIDPAPPGFDLAPARIDSAPPGLDLAPAGFDSAPARIESAPPRIDYYAHHAHRDDAGYLNTLVDSCRAAVSMLPSFAAVAAPARRAAARIAAYQSLNQAEHGGGHAELRRWAAARTLPGSDLRWWETAASAGSSLAVFVLIAVAAQQAVRTEDAVAIERAYFPWIGSLHTLLDSLIDRRDDLASGQRCLLDYYASPQEATAGLVRLAGESLRRATTLPNGHQHSLVIAGMTSHYLSSREAAHPEALPTARAVLGAIGGMSAPTMVVMGARRVLGRG